jgi:hypothetical protein
VIIFRAVPYSIEASVGSVLFYVRRITLLCRILDIAVTFGSILVDPGVIASSFVAMIGRRHRRHFIVT